MSEDRPSPRGMSLIPYVPEQSREIVLRHNSTVVIYDPRSKQISLRDASGIRDSPKCPMCHRPFGDMSGDASEQQPNQMNPEYFHMLDQSLNGPSAASRGESIRRRLPGSLGEPVGTPPGAEFVASEPRTPPVTQGISPSAFSQNYFRTFFREERELGKGGKGVVVLVTHILDGCELGHFACKRVPVGNNHDWLEKVLLEVRTLQNLSHPNLVSYRHVWLEDYQINSFSPKVPFCFILQQFCNSGDLHHYVLNPPKTSFSKDLLKDRLRRRSKGQVEAPVSLNAPRRLSFDDIYAFFMDITDGLHYLHSHGFIHRDIKPSNCLLHIDTNGKRPRVLLSDFGEVQVTNSSRTGTGATGTVSYCAPEVLQRDGLDGAFGNFTVKSDIFSVGMIVFFMCFARLPYIHADEANEENENIDLLREEIIAWAGFNDNIRRGRTDLPNRMYSFLKRLLAVDPNERPTTDEILHSLRSNSETDDQEPHSPMEERQSIRISPLDSPSPHPRRNTLQSRIPSIGSPPDFSPHNNVNRSVSPLKSASTAAGTMEDDSEYESDDTIPVDISSTAIVRARNSIHSRPSSPSKLHQHNHSPPPLALPPPPPSTLYRFLFPFARMSHSTQAATLIKLCLFGLKYLSLSHSCRPMSARPAIAVPLMILGAMDLILGSGMDERNRSILPGSLILAVIHVVVLLLAASTETLCDTWSTVAEAF